MSRKKSLLQSTAFGILIGLVGLLIIGYVLYQYPPINDRLSWRVEYAIINVKSMINPVKPFPTALPTPVIKKTAATAPRAAATTLCPAAPGSAVLRSARRSRPAAWRT